MAIVDTGSNVLAGPKQAIRMLMKNLGVQLNCSNLASLPVLELRLGDAVIKIPPRGYVMRLALPDWLRDVMHNSQELPARQPGANSSGVAAPRIPNQVVALEEFYKVALARGLDFRSALDQHLRASVAARDPNATAAPAATASAANTPSSEAPAAAPDPSPAPGPAPALAPAPDAGGLRSNDEPMGHICMPAIVELDQRTKLGDLWVIGRPLFARYYARFSYPKQAAAPAIFVKETSRAAACTGQADVLGKGISVVEGSARVSRSWDGRAVAASEAEASEDVMAPVIHPTELVELQIEDIRYPHWAVDLDAP